MRSSAWRKMSWAGHDVGSNLIIVFISTTRAASLMSRSRNVSNCATRRCAQGGQMSGRHDVGR